MYTRIDTPLIRQLATSFRDAILHSDPDKLPITLSAFPRGACADASLLLSKYLDSKGIRPLIYMYGNNGNQTHAWLESEGVIIDITADQFDEISDPVLVTTDRYWHRGFEDGIEISKADIDIYDERTKKMLYVAYEEILKQIMV